MYFKNKTVLITGGASGIGKIMGRKSLERGCKNLIIWDIDELGSQKTKDEFSKIGGEIFIFKTVMRQYYIRVFLSAGPAPTGPKVNQHIFATER